MGGRRPLFALAILFGGVATLTLILFFVCDQTLDSLRVVRQMADMWIEADRSACLQLDRCLEHGGADCELVDDRLKRPIAYWHATLERAKPHPDIALIRQYLHDTGTDISPWRFRYHLFERTTALVDPQLESPASRNTRTTGQLPTDLQMVLNLAARARQARASSPPNASEVVALHETVEQFHAGLDVGKQRFDKRVAESSVHLRRVLYLLVLSSVLLIFLAAVFITRRLLHNWQAVENQYRQRDQELSRSLADRVAELQKAVEEKESLLGQLETRYQELQSVEAALRRSNHDLQQFAYVASHDLREPLRNVSTYTDLLTRTWKSGKMEVHGDHCLSVIKKAAIRMDALVTGLLAYARLASQATGVMEPTDMNVVVDQALTNLQTAIAESQATITKPDLPPATVNPMQMMQVFQNLIGNAIRYRRPDVPLVIRIGSSTSDNGLVFHIEDNGRGFKQEYAETIFGMFQRLEATEVSGTGVGLTICKSVIDKHGGRIWAEGRLGEGATFSFTLPKAKHN